MKDRKSDEPFESLTEDPGLVPEPTDTFMTGTLSCTMEACVAFNAGNAVYQMAYPIPEASAPDAIMSLPCVDRSFVLASTQGIQSDFAARWLRSCALTWPVAFPTVTLLAPWVRRAVSAIT